MPNLKASIKDLKRSRRRAIRNADVRSEVKTAIKKAREAIGGRDAEAALAATRSASRLLDKATTKGAVHKHAAARTKSRLARHLRAAQPEAVRPDTPATTEEASEG